MKMSKNGYFILVFMLALYSCLPAQEIRLDSGFRQPPDSARPHTWWHWMNGNITREGITADLEAMARVGVGGAQIFNVGDRGSVNIPIGPINYLSPEWLDLVHHAVKEAERLGLELCFHNCAGWSSSGGPWISPQYSMQKITWSEAQVSSDSPAGIQLAQPQTVRDYYRDIVVLAFPTPKDSSFRIKDARVKAGFDTRYGMQPSRDQVPADAIIPLKSVIDISDKMDASGKLNWKAPSGQWTVLRIGHTSTGKTNHPAPDSGLGLECDKCSRAALDVHWNGGVQPVLDKMGPLAGKVLNNILVDSYEVGLNNWTPKMREDFIQRRGYDLWRYLPTLTGRVIEDGITTERFLWDYRRTTADLIGDNYFGYFAEKCRSHGLLCSIEPYDGPFECLAVGAKADIVMGEFWVGGSINHSVKLAASVAHTHGVTLVGAESFTSAPDQGRWLNHPGSLKGQGDLVWCTGVNRYIFHRYAHQPWLDVYPGMTMGQWGTNFERTNTWWEPGKAWMTYIARSQYLLQQGRFAADVLFFAGEAAPNGSVTDNALRDAGYDFDVCGTDLIDKIEVEDGRIMLPGGMRYHLLVLPDTPYMTPRLANKVRQLVRDGATVLAPRPDMSPSLNDYPDCDRIVRAAASEVWGSAAGRNGDRRFGNGRVYWGFKPLDVLKRMEIAPDCLAKNPQANLVYIHRIVDNTDIYFVSNQADESIMADVFFRVNDRRPELWDAVTGSMKSAGLWQASVQGTQVTLPLGPKGSVFVMFRRPTRSDRVTYTAVQQANPRSVVDLLPRPKHELKILEAVYGVFDCTGDGMVDVTGKLNEMVRNNRLEVVASNSLAGDPLRDVVKNLYVEYEYDGKTARAQVTENKTLVLPPAGSPSGRPLRIIIAGYGKLDEGKDWLPKLQTIDVTKKVAAAVKDNMLRIQATNEFAGKDPAYLVPKRLRIRYSLDGLAEETVVAENREVRLPAMQWRLADWLPELTGRRQGTQMLAWDNGRYTLRQSDGQEKVVTVDSLPALIMADQPWTVDFTPGWGAPDRIKLPRLISWSDHDNPGVRYYSGTATYRSQMAIPDNFKQAADRIWLDLGQVCCLAEVIVNGQNLGVLWCNPYRVDITDAARAGDNDLEIRVTNLWVNRIIGDEQLPDDCEWSGKPLKEWPEWFLKGQKRPSAGRFTFTTWKHWTQYDKLLPSGLLGPVYLRAGDLIDLEQ